MLSPASKSVEEAYLKYASVCVKLREQIIERFRGGWVQPHIRSVGAARPTPGNQGWVVGWYSAPSKQRQASIALQACTPSMDQFWTQSSLQTAFVGHFMQLPADVSVRTASRGLDMLGQAGRPPRHTQALQVQCVYTHLYYLWTCTQVAKDLYTIDGNETFREMQFLRHVWAYRETSILIMVG